jgi:glycosyltransferase involved in cell wall biosynthesis
MKISYSILTHNETDSLQNLLDFLVKRKDEEDEIVILDDYSDNERTQELLDFYVSVNELKFEQRHLMNDFAGQKNHLKNMCSGDYIFNLDADEIPHKRIMNNLKPILEANPSVDLYYVPRVNTVDGLTQDHINHWGWNVNEKGWINFPDWQGRIWRNRPNIRWEKPVHEMLVGFKQYTYLPAEEEFAFYHPKDIKRQEQQNMKYSGIIRDKN